MSDSQWAVLDASVALKWRLRDEEATRQADALLDDFVTGALNLMTPTLFDYEIANALKTAVVMERLSEEQAVVAITDYQQYRIERHGFLEFQQLALQLACHYQRSVYDGAYLALAQSKGVWFYTGDKRLFNAVGKTLPWVQWIGDYRLGAIPVSDNP